MLLGTLKPIRRVYEGGRIHALIFLNYKYIPNRSSPRSIKIKSDRELGTNELGNARTISSISFRQLDIVDIVLGQDGRGGEREREERDVCGGVERGKDIVILAA